MLSFAAFIAMTDTILQRISVPFEYPVVFTRSVFSPSNPVLQKTVCQKEPSRRHRILAVVDAGVARARPGLIEEIQGYASAYSERLELVHPPRVVTGGEAAKNDVMGLAALINAMVERRLCRQSFVVVVGGGAVLDAVGFAAALVHRGLRLIRIPTTVLAQCDSGVGVKNAINLNGVKNLVGTFAPPFAVVNDFDFLRTLPEGAWTDGIAEAFKVAIIKDRVFFDWLTSHASDLRARDEQAMEYLIRRCAELHLEHIRSHGDPFEFGSAKPLDFGHWSAHRLEAMSNYRISHGRAVAIGLALDAAYAVAKGWLSPADFDRLYLGLAQAGFELWHELLEKKRDGELDLMRGLQEFQEHLGGDLSLTMPDGIGAAREVFEMDPALIAASIAELKRRAGR
ncbi:MAG: 3-dehydroquinate synthase [Kiritimatiellae bacterium]|nr:3-dehydroquinate synthase [Kiritimatiellia bacterium]MDW8458146.1 3-dehydroquinate synthase [Verrucomicrobiota bacterium]